MRGITLIEVLLYLAIVSLLLTTALTVAYSITAQNDSELHQLLAEQDRIFVREKIDWAFAGATSAYVDHSNGSLVVQMSDTQISPVIFLLNTQTHSMTLREGSSVPTPITSSNSEVANFTVTPLTTSAFSFAFQIGFTINGENTTINRYIP